MDHATRRVEHAKELKASTRHHGEVFQGLGLERAKLGSFRFEECIFDRCDLSDADLGDCRFVDCVFLGSDLSLVQIPGAVFISSWFEDSKLIGVNWTRANWEPIQIGDPLRFERCLMDHSSFIGMRLQGVQIRNCRARDVDFREADLSKSNLSGTDLADSLFFHTDLTSADLRTARNYTINPAENVLHGAKFSLPEAMALLYSLDIELTASEV
jgi:uncharacterized protein YjbI with pentapeptide repeats